MNKRVVIFGGSTIAPISNHLSIIGTLARGTTARKLASLTPPELFVELKLTKTAGGDLETNQDVATEVDKVVADTSVKIVFFPISVVDFEIAGGSKLNARFKSTEPITLRLTPTDKLIHRFRKTRKDLFLVGFKETCALSEDAQYLEGLSLCKKASCNLVVANDYATKVNMIITPEESRYCVTTDRDQVLKEVMQMARDRSNLTFTRSTVVGGELVPWNSELVYPSLRKVVNWCREHDAYKPFNGVTTGHFACRLEGTEDTFITSIRKTNFNNLTHLVKIRTDGPDNVLAYGAKPSVGGQSQRIIFNTHRDFDCIVHFHCPKKPESDVPSRSQREFECGSHECGKNTSDGLKEYDLGDGDKLSAVFLDNHGPNIVFHHSVPAEKVIHFIASNFDLEKKTGGYVHVTS